MGLALVAAIVNLICLVLLRRDQSGDVNMEAAKTFSMNDFASNGGILVAGGLVMWLDQAWPDLVVGMLVAVPLAAALGVLVRFAASEYLQSRLYRGHEGLRRDDTRPQDTAAE